MIPYWSYDPIIEWGWLRVHAFGVLVAVGILVGSWVTLRRARERKVDELHLRSAITWLLVGGFVVAHLFTIIAYEPEKIAKDPLVLLKLWEGLASTGGFFGAFIGLYLYTRRNKLAFGPYADVVALGLLPGWFFGRMGCYTAHDHPGHTTDFFLAVNYPAQQGGPRHDLGFYEMLFTLVLWLAFEVVRRKLKDAPPGRIAALIGFVYSPVRIALDFLRIAKDDPSGLHGDVRYFGLTPAQYAFIFLFFLCAYLLFRRTQPSVESQAAAPTGRAKAAARRAK
jgi:phosphatidylglycerol:prolipoprotein diacylglycerol transferase